MRPHTSHPGTLFSFAASCGNGVALGVHRSAWAFLGCAFALFFFGQSASASLVVSSVLKESLGESSGLVDGADGCDRLLSCESSGSRPVRVVRLEVPLEPQGTANFWQSLARTSARSGVPMDAGSSSPSGGGIATSLHALTAVGELPDLLPTIGRLAMRDVGPVPSGTGLDLLRPPR